MTIVYICQRVTLAVVLLWALYIGPNLELSRKMASGSPSIDESHAQTNAPSARFAAGMAFDSKRGVTVLFGGIGGNSETWEFNGSIWQNIPTGSAPSIASIDGMTYDVQRSVMVLLEGQSNTWEYDGSNWTQVSTSNSPPARNNVSLTYDSNRQIVVLSSGHLGTFCNSGTDYTDVWEYNGTNWVEILTSGGPLNEVPSIAYDPIRQKTIHFVGRHNCDLKSQTWVYDGLNITQLSPSTAPPPTSGPIVFDTRSAKLVLFGGCIDSNSVRCTQYSNDIWTFDGATWNLLNIVNKPPGRYLHSITYDESRQRLIVFGGCADFYWGGNCMHPLGDLWEFDGTQWIEFFPNTVYLPLITK